MNLQVGVADLLKLGTKLIGHKIVQYNLGTKVTTVIKTVNGRVRGLQRKTLYDEELYFAFEGIPYAKPPLGELRFRAPQPAEPWEGIRDCTYPRAKPIQEHFVMHVVEGSEDCLYLNVYAKNLKSEKPLPVIVFIYGGGFQIGEATRDIYSPDYLMQKNVILVTLNYRLGALGFLSLSDRDLDVPGNAGLKDQVMALRWIHDNIAHFNGDPNNITLTGNSAGAASTQIMMTTEQTRGLFHKVILMSGSSLSCWANEPKHNWPHRLASQLGYTGTDNEKEVFRFLQRASARDIAGCSTIQNQEETRDYILFPFGPVVEPYVSASCVVSRPPVETLSVAWGNALPAIIGGTSFEGLFCYQFVMRDQTYFLSAFESLIPREVRDISTPAQLKELIRRLKLMTFDDATRGRMEFKECLQLNSIKQFWHSMHRTVLARLAYAPTTPTYLYRFDFDSPTFNNYRILQCGRHARGVSHADDIFYLFYSIPSSKLDKSSPEYRTIERLVDMWTAFAANSNPNGPQLAPVSWEALEPNSTPMCLNIGQRLEFIELPELKQLKLWDSFYDNLKLY
ncbi:esterase B1 [Drosophila grimshawi]|uniref:carboxylesterase n=1 Tax=Drosophila grimshawi TaxID=7222 RepID=B4JF83_DROGR|nr:esterase B1 [Drosophila grimshawi]EDV93364.1 GH18313 [Drosophila grimshawi]